MAETIVYISMSLDGYLADVNKSVNWLDGDGSDTDNPGTYKTFFNSIDTIILGNATYKQITTELSPDQWVYSGAKTYVLSKNKHEDILDKEIYFTSENPKPLIDRLRTESSKDIWIAGGASVVNTFINLNEVDRYRIAIIPTILGNGIKLFDNILEVNNLKLISTTSYNGIVELEYINR